jgi:hypothetical protein
MGGHPKSGLPDFGILSAQVGNSRLVMVRDAWLCHAPHHEAERGILYAATGSNPSNTYEFNSQLQLRLIGEITRKLIRTIAMFYFSSALL